MENEIDKVKKKLWSYGYNCKDVSDIPGLDYDLIVNGEHQVKVVAKGADLDAVPNRIIVAQVDGDEIRYHLCKRGVCREESSPLKAFPKVDKSE